MKNPIPQTIKRGRVKIMFTEPSLTEQSHAKSCDINLIIKKFTETGVLPTNLAGENQYGYVPDIDFKSALDLVKNTQREFEELSVEEKQLFGNNSSNYATFLTNYVEDPQIDVDDLKAEPDTNVSQTAKDSKEKGLAPNKAE